MKHRILMISHGHPAFSKGGAEIASYNLHSEFLRRDDCTSLYLARRGDEIPGHHATAFSSVGPNEILFRSHVEHFIFSHNGLDTITRDFRQLLDDYTPTVVHFHHYTHLGLELIREVKNWNPKVTVILTLHEYLAICDNFGQMITTQGRLCNESSPTRCAVCKSPRTAPEFFFRERFIKSFFTLVDHFISPSQFLIDRYVAWGLPVEKITLIENGLPPEAVSSGDESPLPDDHIPCRFGYFGQINPFKGLDVLLEAVMLLPKEVKKQIRVEVHGSGLEHQTPEFQSKIRELLEKTRKVVKYFGPYEPKDGPVLMRGVDWVVVPSVWWENSPLVIQEAFANLRPPIVSNIGGMAEKVKHGVNGLQFRVKNPADLAKTLQEALNHGQYQKVRAAIESRLPVAKIAEQHLAIYNGKQRTDALSEISIRKEIETSKRRTDRSAALNQA